MIPAIILPEAEEEMIISAQYYNKEVINLGFDFLTEIDYAIRTISKSLTRWSFVDETIQKYILKRFPFSIFYEFLKDENKIIVISIAHQKRTPIYWKDRIKHLK